MALSHEDIKQKQKQKQKLRTKVLDSIHMLK